MAPRKTTDEPANVGEIIEQMDREREVTDASTGEVSTGPHVFRAIAAVMAALGDDPIKKEKEAKEGNKFKYRGIDQVYAALNPLLSRHNLVILPRVRDWRQIERQTASGKPMYYTNVTVDHYFVSSIDGSSHVVTTIGEAMDMSDKSTNKAMSVAYKYACFLAFCIPVDEVLTDDPDAQGQVDMAPSGGTARPVQQQPRQQPKGKAPPISEEEANTNYRAAESALSQCTSVAALKKAWAEINWDRIPAPWHIQLQKLQKEMVEEFKKAMPPPTSAPPARPSFPMMPAFAGDDEPIPE